jgi:hypothetical protein
MAQDVNNSRSVPKHQIDDLVDVYNDFLYMVRIHEDLIQHTPAHEMAGKQIASMNSKGRALEWDFAGLTDKEKQEFANYMNNDVSADNKKCYVCLQHIESNRDKFETKNYAFPPYSVVSAHMPLPSAIDRFRVFFPADAKLGEVEFLVDGEYKVSFKSKNIADKPLREVMYDTEECFNFNPALNIIEGFVQDKGMQRFHEILMDVCADQSVSVNENNILEMIGIFAEKLLNICRKKYNCTNKQNELAFKLAEKDGLIKSADVFMDYFHLRHFLRHQWDTLDGLGNPTQRSCEENKSKRDLWVKSYLKICGKSRKERMKNYVEVLHQMQYAITKLKPNWLVRDKDESKNKYFERIKAAQAKSHGHNIIAELNYPLSDEKNIRLNKLIHKVLPNVRIADEFPNGKERLEKMNDYNIRSWFIKNYEITEYMVMMSCVRRGENLDKHSAWQSVISRGIMSSEEANAWEFYSDVRNALSHNCFNEYLRAQVTAISHDFEKDFTCLRNKLYLDGPAVYKVDKGVMRYVHKDGLDVEINNNNHTVEFQNIFPDNETDKKYKAPHKENYRGGTEISVWAEQVISTKLPNGVIINLDTQSVDFGNGVVWKTSDKNLNGFFTEKSRVLTNKSLRVVEARERNMWLPVEGSDDFLVDYKHSVRLDSDKILKSITVRNNKQENLKAKLLYFNDGTNVMWFDDGTIVTQSAGKMVVSHNGCVLKFNNRRMFASTYLKPIQQQNNAKIR